MGDILAFDAKRERSNRRIRLKNPSGTITHLDGSLPDGVLLRVIRREGEKEVAKLNELYKLTKGHPEDVPSGDQREAMEDGFFEI
jgi:hypothetical protein